MEGGRRWPLRGPRRALQRHVRVVKGASAGVSQESFPMRVGVLTGGGDCPGLNAVIRAVTKSLINHGQCEVLGIADGFEGLMLDPPGVKPLGWDEVSGILHVGGTILGTSNSANPLRDAATLEHVGRNVRALGLDVVVAIGGDGTRSEEHTSELQSQSNLVCRLLLE